MKVMEKESDKMTDCKNWYEEKQECLKITRLIQEQGVIGFIGTMSGQKRSCCGFKERCVFV